MNKNEYFFQLAQKEGILEAELYINKSHSTNISLFHGEIENFSDENECAVFVRGIFNGKCASVSLDNWSKENIEYAIKKIKENASYIENTDPVIIFPGSEEYKKINTFNKELENISLETKINTLKLLESEMKSYHKDIKDVCDISYSESSDIITLLNSNGLKLKTKNNYYVFSGQCIVKNGKQTKSNFDFFLDNDFSKFNYNSLCEKICNGALDKLGGKTCKTDKYCAVLSAKVVSELLKYFISHTDAEEVQKHSSLFENKLNKSVASKNITIEDKPLDKTIYARGFDDEGVATYNKKIIDRGKLCTYLYTLTTAKLDNVIPTGNGMGLGSKKHAEPILLSLKPGKNTFEELIKKADNGVYITEINGLHAGLNEQSGNFSLQSSGFMIKNGKIDYPLDLITISGNLFDLFNNVIDLANDTTLFASAIKAVSILIKELSISN